MIAMGKSAGFSSIALLLIVGLLIAGGITYAFITQPDVLKVITFEECVRAGYDTTRYLTVPTSAIRSCTTPLGWTFKVPDSIRTIDSFEECMEAGFAATVHSTFSGGTVLACGTADGREFPNPDYVR